ncbi:PP2C family protein-serine/threonine phosphatase [Luteitalea sp.]|uniref:PP2C family protein-serine/threonine phosphatase n=1 Tax=Luteitalea sp. TaxID=2004800 RepID=UPI000AAEDBE2|nr:PP2C family protein-serine/threonine phosphatase [Luteitalea sp.]
MSRRTRPIADRARAFIDDYTRDLTARDLQRVFTRETRDMVSFFTQGTSQAEATQKELLRHPFRNARQFFLAFAMRLTAARRMLYAGAIVLFVFGLVDGLSPDPGEPLWDNGLVKLLLAFGLIHLILLLEVADRLTLKHELNVARDIQRAMLPAGTLMVGTVEAHGETQPANTVGGDFYDILPRADGHVLVILGDVAGKGTPAALLMALFLAMTRTLLDEALPPAGLALRLNEQLMRHSPRSRFITAFIGLFDPRTGEVRYVNAGQNPPMVRRASGRLEWLAPTGMALGLSRKASYDEATVTLSAGDVLLAYSDGITEAESPNGASFEEDGLRVLADQMDGMRAGDIARVVIDAVKTHTDDTTLFDDLTVLVCRRVPDVPPPPPLPIG